MDEPKKRRRLLIVDVDENNVPIPPGTVSQAVAPPVPIIPRTPIVLGPGHVQGKTQQEVLRLCRQARFDEEKIEARIWHRVDEILKAKTYAEAQAYAKNAIDAASIYFLLNTKKPEKQAKDEKADKQLAKAKRIRAEIAAEAAAEAKKP